MQSEGVVYPWFFESGKRKEAVCMMEEDQNGGCGGCPPAARRKNICFKFFFFGKALYHGEREGLRLGLRARRKVSSFRQAKIGD
jgi:hypothetical protein